ncbi:MAG TPA: diguanylate cyclase [Polyangiaceae bacterium]|jgi:diguanylate cyclase (GGDEF)-like protein|nr:diguanylate cyclase [Polyangiaceae bacterium]
MRILKAEGRGTVLLLMATLASLVVTIVAGYLTRLSLIETTWWVTHTEEVKLSIAKCEHALDHGDAEALRRGEATVADLTVDNPRQQKNVARAATLTSSHAELEELFKAMQREEDGLLAERTGRFAAGRAESSVAFVVAAALTAVLGIAAFALLRAQRQGLARQGALLEAIIETVDEGIIAVDPSRKILAINAVARSMWGGSAPRDRWPEDWRPVLRAVYEDGALMKPEDGPLARALRGETTEGSVYRVVPVRDPPADTGIWISASARPIRDPLGTTVAAVTTLRNITDLRANAERLRDLSLTDELTGLLNRRGFLAAASARINLARRTTASTAVLFADVNGLKRINDELGHEQGDRTIQDAAHVLRSIFREGDVVARIGGDEFVALLPNFSPAAREPLLERLAAAIRALAEQEVRPYRLTLSTGLTFMDWERGQTLDDLLAEADRRMYERKRERAGQSSPVLRPVPRNGG